VQLGQRQAGAGVGVGVEESCRCGRL